MMNAQARHFRIDTDHSDAFATWQRMGAPMQPTAAQYAQLEQAGKLGVLVEPASKEWADNMDIRFAAGSGVFDGRYLELETLKFGFNAKCFPTR